MTDENINLVLTNSLCCIGKYAVKVSKLLSINDKCADSEVIKLKLINNYFNAALCYNNTVVNTNTIISISTNTSSIFYTDGISVLSKSYELIINGTSYVFVGDGTSTILTLIISKLTMLGLYVSYTQTTSIDKSGLSLITITFTLSCTVKSMLLYYFISVDSKITVIGKLITLGICTPVSNCLTEIEFEIIINKLMEACKICPCQLV